MQQDGQTIGRSRLFSVQSSGAGSYSRRWSAQDIRNALHLNLDVSRKNSGANKPNILLASKGLLRAKKQLLKHHHQMVRRKQSMLNYAERHERVLAQYTIRARVPTQEQTIIQGSRAFVFLPTDHAFKLWQLLVVVTTYYQVISVPYSLAFQPRLQPTQDYGLIVSTLIYSLDIIVHFNTAIKIHDTLITDRCTIAQVYLTSSFVVDFIAAIPMDLLLYATNYQESNWHYFSILKVARFPHLVRISTIGNLVDFLRLRPEKKRWFLYSRYAHLIRLLLCLVILAVIIHFLACIWYGLIADENWVEDMFATNTTVIDIYLLSYYYTLTAVMGQSIIMQSNKEYAFSTMVIVIGSLLIAVVYGNVAVLISNFYEDQNCFKHKMEALFSSMNLMRLPKELQKRIVLYYQIMYERHGTLNGHPQAFTKELSNNLSTEVELFLRMNMITRTPLFHECSSKVVQELIMRLKFQVYLPQDCIVVRGEVGHDMYFIASGYCEVRNAAMPRAGSCSFIDEPPEAILTQGDYFGELALLFDCKRMATIIAKSFTELCVLTRRVYMAVMEKYPEDRAVIEQTIRSKYNGEVLQDVIAQHGKNKHLVFEHDAAVINCLNALNERLLQVEDSMADLGGRLASLVAARKAAS